MPKRLVAFVAAFALAFIIVGCSSGNNPASQTSASSSETTSSSSRTSLFVADGFPQNEVTAEVPVPKFSVGTSSVQESDTLVQVAYDAVPEAEVASYVEEIKAAGFTFDANETKSSNSYTYSAQNRDSSSSTPEGFTQIILSYGSDGNLLIQVMHYVPSKYRLS